jgi:hypothetical protein
MECCFVCERKSQAKYCQECKDLITALYQVMNPPSVISKRYIYIAKFLKKKINNYIDGFFT